MSSIQMLENENNINNEVNICNMFRRNGKEMCSPLTDCTNLDAQRQNLVSNSAHKSKHCIYFNTENEKIACSRHQNSRSTSEIYILPETETATKNYINTEVRCGNNYPSSDETSPNACANNANCNVEPSSSLSSTSVSSESSVTCCEKSIWMRHEPYAICLLKPEDSLYTCKFTYATFKPLDRTSSYTDNQIIRTQKSMYNQLNLDDANSNIYNNVNSRENSNELSNFTRSIASCNNSENSAIENTRCTVGSNVSGYQQYLNSPPWYQGNENNYVQYDTCQDSQSNLRTCYSDNVVEENLQTIKINNDEFNDKICSHAKEVEQHELLNYKCIANSNRNREQNVETDYCEYIDSNNNINNSQYYETNTKDNDNTTNEVKTNVEVNSPLVAMQKSSSINSNDMDNTNLNNGKENETNSLKCFSSCYESNANEECCLNNPIRLPPSRYQIQQSKSIHATCNNTHNNRSSINKNENDYDVDDNNNCDDCNSFDVNNANHVGFSSITYCGYNSEACKHYRCNVNEECESSEKTHFTYANNVSTSYTNNNSNNEANSKKVVDSENNEAAVTSNVRHKRFADSNNDNSESSFTNSAITNYYNVACDFNSLPYETKVAYIERLAEKSSSPTSELSINSSLLPSFERSLPKLADLHTPEKFSSFTELPDKWRKADNSNNASAVANNTAAKNNCSTDNNKTTMVDRSISECNQYNAEERKNEEIGNEQGQRTSPPVAKCITTPIKNLSKIYVSGRPLPVRRNAQSRRQVVEVKINLRHSEDDFLITNLHAMFGPEIKLGDLVGRYVLVEGDRGIDMGQIINVLKTNVVTNTDINQFGSFDNSFVNATNNTYYASTIDEFQVRTQSGNAQSSRYSKNADQVDATNNGCYSDNDNNDSDNCEDGPHQGGKKDRHDVSQSFSAENKSQPRNNKMEQHNEVYHDESNEEQLPEELYPCLDHLPAPTTEEMLEEQFMPRVIRQATYYDEEEMVTLMRDEAEARHYCEECLQRIHLSVPIHIEDVIFQFDRKKLIVRYTSNAYVDFNVLTRTLHNRYKCRIWMDQVNRDQCEGVHDRKRHNNNINVNTNNNKSNNSNRNYHCNDNYKNNNYSFERNATPTTISPLITNNNDERYDEYSYQRNDNNNFTSSNNHHYHKSHLNNYNNNTRYSTRRRPFRRSNRTSEEFVTR